MLTCRVKTNINEPTYDKTHINTCDQRKHGSDCASAQSDPSLRWSHCCLQSPGYPKRDKRVPLPYWVDVHADLRLCWLHRSYCRFCRALAQNSLLLGDSAYEPFLIFAVYPCLRIVHDNDSCAYRGWLGVAKVSCILRHKGVQLILAYSWARPVVHVEGKGRGGMFLFLLFLPFHSCSSFFPVAFISSSISSIYFLPFSGRRHKMTHKGWCVIKP